MAGRRNELPRKSSLKGVTARQERRIKSALGLAAKGGKGGGTKMHKPGSQNQRKVGR